MHHDHDRPPKERFAVGIAVLLATFIATVVTAQAPVAPADARPSVLSMPTLKDYYTPELRAAGEKGTVRVKVCIDAAGVVTSTELLDSSGFKRLDLAAEQFIRGFRFKPGMVNGVAQAGCVGLPVAFTPDQVPQPPPPPAAQPPANKSVVISAPSIDDFYPEEALQRGEQGTVRVKICYDDKGRVTTAEVAQTSGSLTLDDAGLSMARQYRFKPGSKSDTLKPDCTVAPMGFRIGR